MNSITVKTREELKHAIEMKSDEIHVVGELVTQVRKARKILTLRVAALAAIAVLVPLLAFAPFTGGATGAAAGVGFRAAAGLTGMEIATILFVVFFGVGMLTAFFKDYDEIEATLTSVKFRRKSAV